MHCHLRSLGKTDSNACPLSVCHSPLIFLSDTLPWVMKTIGRSQRFKLACSASYSFHALPHEDGEQGKMSTAWGAIADPRHLRHSQKRLKPCRHSHPQCYQGRHSFRPLIYAVSHIEPGLRELCLGQSTVGPGWNTAMMLRTESEISASNSDRAEQINNGSTI